MDAFAELNRALVGRYRIEAELGRGGMASVFLADDLRNDRKVAIKVFGKELSAAVGVDRFIKEIRTTANLRHPNILPLFDSGATDGFLYYAMPHVEGESLRERLNREGQLPVETATSIISEVGQALDHAHRSGVLHRDIKPSNIMLLDGRPVLMDFGIALVLESGGGDRLTRTGFSMGTPQYMSPEQVAGGEHIGPRTDIYSLGCVLYELLVGRPPFSGATSAAVLSRVLTGEYEAISTHRPKAPVHVEAAVARALERVPADRFATATEFVAALNDPSFRHGSFGVQASRNPWRAIAVGALGVALLLGTALAWALTRSETPSEVIRMAAPFAGGPVPVQFSPDDVSYRISPDGERLVYVVRGEDGRSTLWTRRVSELTSSPIPNTEGVGWFTVSPNGGEVAFTRDRDGLVVTPIEGGPVRVLGRGGLPVWGGEGSIFAMASGGISRLDPNSGDAEVVYRPQPGVPVYLADVVPDGSSILLLAPRDEGNEILSVDLETGVETSMVMAEWANYVRPGFLIYLTADGTLLATRVDAESLVPEGLNVTLATGVSAFTTSGSGSLLYATGPGPRMDLVWADRAGNIEPLQPGWSVDPGRGNAGWSLAPDGTQLALRVRDRGQEKVWIKEVARDVERRLTFGEGRDVAPRWAPDGRSVLFVSTRGGRIDLWSRPADGTGGAERIVRHSDPIAEAAWTASGTHVVLRTSPPDLLLVQPGVDSVAVPLVATASDETQPELSPDDAWLAYVSTETGIPEVFVRPFPDVSTAQFQVSNGGGMMPMWSPDGDELFYVRADRDLVAVSWRAGGSVPAGDQTRLFTLPPDIVTDPVVSDATVGPRAERFLFARTLSVQETSFVFVHNLVTELRQRLPR